jgi:hypothetical protein
MTRTRLAALSAAVTLGGLACAVGERAAARAPDPVMEENVATVTSSSPPIDLAARQVRACTATFALG